LVNKMSHFPWHIPAEDLRRERLEAFVLNKENNTSFNYGERTFLIELAIASGIISSSDIESNEAKVFDLMAHIGNIQGLKTWYKAHAESISPYYKGVALRSAAKAGHITCVQYLIETCGQDIREHDQGVTLKAAAYHGQVACVQYLVEAFGQSISEEDKGWALRLAAQEVLKQAAEKNVAFSSNANSLIFTSTMQEENTSSKKRKREENNSDTSSNKKNKNASDDNEEMKENENNTTRWLSCSLM